MRKTASLGLAMALAGCAGGLPLGPDVVVSGAKYVAVQGEADLVVRTFLVDPAGQKREVAGATCAIDSSLYSARLTTPARLRVPNFGPQSPVLTLTCAAGELKGGGQVGIETFWRAAPGSQFGSRPVRSICFSTRALIFVRTRSSSSCRRPCGRTSSRKNYGRVSSMAVSTPSVRIIATFRIAFVSKRRRVISVAVRTECLALKTACSSCSRKA